MISTRVYLLTISLLSLFSFYALADSCDSSTGIKLTAPGKPFANITPRDQGRLGICFSYAATDLLRSHVGAPLAFNVFDAAVNSDEDVDGGDPAGVMKSLITRGWACTDTYKFQNLFPSSGKNILTELEEISMDMPVFYTYDLTNNLARQDRIALKAGNYAKNSPSCDLVYGSVAVEKEIEKLYSEINKILSKSSKLKNELNTLDWGWVNYISGSKANAEIQTEIESLKTELNSQENRLKSLEAKKEIYDAKKLGKNNLDKYSEEQAAEIVYYWGLNTYKRLKSVFLKYGLDSKYVPSLEQYIKERVKKDPVYEWGYAGRLYAYKLVKLALANSCVTPNRQVIPKNIKTQNYLIQDATEGVNKIKAQLEKSKGAILSMHSGLLSTGTWISGVKDYHAVVVVGCKTVNGQMQFLIHNSWGAGCGNYYKNFSCTEGRVWVPAISALQASAEVEWLEN